METPQCNMWLVLHSLPGRLSCSGRKTGQECWQSRLGVCSESSECIGRVQGRPQTSLALASLLPRSQDHNQILTIHRAGERSQSHQASWVRRNSPGGFEDTAGRQGGDLAGLFVVRYLTSWTELEWFQWEKSVHDHRLPHPTEGERKQMRDGCCVSRDLGLYAPCSHYRKLGRRGMGGERWAQAVFFPLLQLAYCLSHQN